MTLFVVATTLTLLLLVVAVIGLFAMMGELAARVGEEADDNTALPIPEARVGATPEQWPAGLEHVATADTAVLLVLSPLCTACIRMAPTVASNPALSRQDTEFGLVVSCSTMESGTNFLQEYKLAGAMFTAIDVRGEWLVGELAVDVSPTVLVFRSGQLKSASTVASLAAVANVTEGIGTDDTKERVGENARH